MYRFDALDRGIVGRLGRTQLVVLAACGMAGFVSVLSHRYLPVMVVVLAVGVVITVPEPGGMSVREAIAHLHAIEATIIGADIVEYNPGQDVAGMTAMVAAKILKEILGKMIAK